MLYLLLWALCAIAAAMIYRNKGRPAVSAFLVGALLGPIGVLLALLTRPNWGEVRKCPSCGEMQPRHRGTCRACGTTL